MKMLLERSKSLDSSIDGLEYFDQLPRQLQRKVENLFTKIALKCPGTTARAGGREFTANAFPQQPNVHRFLCRLFDSNGDGTINLVDWKRFFGSGVASRGEGNGGKERTVTELLENIDCVARSSKDDVADPWIDVDDEWLFGA